MRIQTLLPAAVFFIAISASGMAYADDGAKPGNAGYHEKDGCYHHHGKELWSKLPEQKRTLLKNAMMDAHKQNEPLHEESKKLHKELDALLTAPSFDKDAYLAKEAQLSDIHTKIKTNMQNAFVSVAGQFTPEERKTLAQLHQMMHHHGEWKHHANQHSQEPNHQPQAD